MGTGPAPAAPTGAPQERTPGGSRRAAGVEAHHAARGAETHRQLHPLDHSLQVGALPQDAPPQRHRVVNGRGLPRSTVALHMRIIP